MPSPNIHYPYTMEARAPHFDPLTPLHARSIRTWLMERFPDRGMMLAAVRLILFVADDGKIEGLEISSPDAAASRSLRKLLLGSKLPSSLHLPQGRYELAPCKA